MADQHRIFKNSQEVMPYLNDIKIATDANRDALGFNPIGVYEDSIKKGKLWVAADAKGRYLGHLMHGGKPPQELRIFQIYVGENSRGLGVASSMIEEITKYGEQLSCLNLRADVANDLTNAVKFWQSQGFQALAPRRKKNLSGREVLIFHKRLSTPSLLPNEPLPLSITAPPIANTLDTYVLDLNVFLTLIKEQTDEKLIAEIMQAALAGEFSLFVTPEFQEELKRTKRENDPIFDLAEKALPMLEKIDDAELDNLQEEVRSIVFPDRSRTRKHAACDTSDLRHLAYCIQNSKAGFITQEKALLRAREALNERYGLNVYSPQDFKIEHFGNADPLSINVPLANDSGLVHIADVKNSSQIRPFMERLGSGLSEMTSIALKSSTRGSRDRKVISVGEQDTCAVYLAQTKGTKHDILEGFFVSAKERFNTREVVFQHILECFMRFSQTIKANTIMFYVRQEDFDLEKICMGRGFQRTSSTVPGMIALIKIPSPVLVTKANWQEFRENFLINTNIELPRLIPAFRTDTSGTPIIQASKQGRGYDAKLFELESLLSPSVLMLPKRTGVIIPIHPTFASHLLSRAEDLLPFATPEEALLRLEKAYFRKPTHAKTFSTGMPIAFYESGSGRGVIGCARITSSKIVSCENALKIYRKHGVLDARELTRYADKKGRVQVITFDNFKVFSNPVSIKKLQNIGCAKANMVGPEKLSHEQLSSIVHEGMGISTKDVVISIQREYVTKILSGKKTIELRKKPFPANGGMRIWIYTTSPTSAIEATAFISKVEADTPENIWKKYGQKGGISKADYDAYYAGSKEAHALHISGARPLKKKLKLQEIKHILPGFTPPQYYRYLDHDSDLYESLITT